MAAARLRSVLEGAKVALAVIVAFSIPGPANQALTAAVDWVRPDPPALSEHLEFAPGWVPPSEAP